MCDRTKPTVLNFSVVEKALFGVDPTTDTKYRIGWCGNGPHSHYTLHDFDDEDRGWYVYVNDKDPLYCMIYDAEMRLVYDCEFCIKCKKYFAKEHMKIELKECDWCVKKRDPYRLPFLG